MPAGTFAVGYQLTPNNWGLNSGNGWRTASFPISFGNVKFSSSPNVVVAINGLDVGNQANTRVQVQAQNITSTGFTLVVIAWADTVLYSVWGMWYAELQ
jgi:hypothetical protein